MNTDTIQVWHGTLAVEGAHYQNYWDILDAVEQAHAERLKTDLLRNRYVEAHGRLRHVLAQTLNQKPEKIRIAKAEHGKPYLVDTPELVFNMSHSENALVIGVAWNCRLGVDMESCKPRTSLSGLVDKCFAEEEIVYWHKLPEAQRVTEFYRFWTRKEAFVKATGRGIGLGLNQCVVNPENQAEFLRVPDDYGRASLWCAQDIALEQGWCGVLVTDKNIVATELIEFES